MASFFAELKRRKVFKLAIVYLVVAWVLVQIVATVEAPLNLPSWFDTAIIVLLAVGFPIALIMSWGYDMTPQGIVKDRAAEEVQEAEAAPVETVAESPPPTDVLPNSVAVLPFENLSPDPDNAYFAAGIHDTILNELAKIRDVNVIARTTMLRYESSDKTVPEIAAELNVGTVMEGSVQYANDRVRITAQLIDPASGSHLWSDIYDRDFSDIFAIQSDIATRIASALEAELVANERQSIETPLTNSTEAYDLYLQAAAIVSNIPLLVTGPPGARVRAHSLLESAIKLDANFALAYARKAFLYGYSILYEPSTESGWLEHVMELEGQTRQYADRALQIDSTIGPAYTALALMNMIRGRVKEAMGAYTEAEKLSPNDPQTAWVGAFLYWVIGKYDDAARIAQRAIDIDPHSADGYQALAFPLYSNGDYETARKVILRAIYVNPSATYLYSELARIELARGDKAAALEALRSADELLADSITPVMHVITAYGYFLLGQTDRAEQLFSRVLENAKDYYIGPVGRAFGYLSIGDQSKALESLQKAVENPALIMDFVARGMIVKNLWKDPVLEQPEFVKVRSDLGASE